MAATSNCSSRSARYAWRKQNPSQTASAASVPASRASPSEDTISPVAEVLAAIRHAAAAPTLFSASGLAAALTRRRGLADRMSLSQRETEVLRLLRNGMSVPAIARQMFISQSTAKTYVARLYDKLGASNRAQALMAAVRLGLIGHGEDEPPSARHVPAPRRVPGLRSAA